MRQLNQSQLSRLEKHNYSCSSASLLDPLMQGWWCWLVNQCPKWLAPNLITITGLSINIVTCLILIYYSPDAKQEVPKWASLLCALGLFIYQSLDAIDGKQARRTGTSSPLGELFDHGCDSLSTVFVSLSVCCAVQLGNRPYWMFFQCLAATTLFYCAHWQTYVSGTLRFGYVDVTEAQFGVMIILVLSGIFGSSFWSHDVPVIKIACMCLPTLVGSMAGAIALSNNFKVILIERGAGRNGATVAIFGLGFSLISIYLLIGVSQVIYQTKSYVAVILWKGAGKNGSSIADTSVLSPIVPLSLMVTPAVLVAWKSTQGVYLENPTLYLLAFGLVAARVTNRLVVAHMTKSEMSYTDPSMMGPFSLFLNQYFNCLIPENYLLVVVFIYVTYDLVKYCREVCLDICDHLQINLFKIQPVDNSGNPSEKNGATAKYNTRSRHRNK